MLLNFCKARSSDLRDLLKLDFLLTGPFDRLVSRTKVNLSLFNFVNAAEPLSELTKDDIPRLTFAECCLQRARDLLALNREIYYISWSGGIDSTCLMTAILQTWPAADLKRLRIVLTAGSIAENPSFFAQYISKFPLINGVVSPSTYLVNTDAILLTGELGDQLFGSDIFLPALAIHGDGILSAPYKEILPTVLETWTKKIGTGNQILDYFNPIAAEAPFKIVTAHDFLWWLNFTQKWQHVKFRFIELKTWDLRARYNTSVAHFFDTPYFQRWSLENHDKKIKKTFASYKFTAKEFIFDFTKNSSDLALVKVQSLKTLYTYSEKRIAVDQNYNEISSIEELSQYVRKI